MNVDVWLKFYDCYGKRCYLCGEQAITKVDGGYVCKKHAPLPVDEQQERAP